jgi:hypothetical protein
MRTGHFLCLLGLMISGCTSTSELTTDDDANSRFKDESAKIFLWSGEAYFGQDIFFKDDSIHFYNLQLKDKMVIANRKVERILLINSGVGGAEGFLIGALAGGIVGILVAPRNVHNPNPEEDKIMGIQKRPFYIGCGSLVGGGIGLTFGLMKGHSFNYIPRRVNVKAGGNIYADSTKNAADPVFKNTP